MRLRVVVLGFFLLTSLTKVFSQNDPLGLSIKLEPVILDTNNLRIQIYWHNPWGDTFLLEKKLLTDPTFTTTLQVDAGNHSATDTLVVPGEVYEYRIKSVNNPARQGYLTYSYKGPGYEFRGEVLIVRGLSAQVLSNYYREYLNDLEGDGFVPIELFVDPNWTASDVRNAIINTKNQYPNMQHVILLGNVPIPLSGYMYPDGHLDHQGAWPADSYYADLTGNYTDATLNYPVAFRSNVAGDGRNDQSLIPDPDSLLELSVGRIDFHGETMYGIPEMTMYDIYFHKNHSYRDLTYRIRNMALINDNFGYFSGESFASSGWRSFIPLVGFDSIYLNQPLTITSEHNNYKFFYGCGTGTWTSCSAAGSISDYINYASYTVFNMMFGSYFGDYYSPNTLLRAPLISSGYGLTNCWSGRPMIYLHQMCSGVTIGQSFLQSQNNSGSNYISNYGGKFTHTALMGDPTLSMNVLPTFGHLNISLGGGVYLYWHAANHPVNGFSVYRKDPGAQSFSLLTELAGTDSFYFDGTLPMPGTKYMVRMSEYQASRCGSYLNFSNGEIVSIDSALFLTGNYAAQKSPDCTFFPNPADKFVLLRPEVAGANETFTVSIIHSEGKKVCTKQVTAFEPLDVSLLEPGMYVFEVQVQGGPVSRNKVMILHESR